MLVYPDHTAEKLGFDVVLETAASKAATPMGVESVRQLKPASIRKHVQQRLEDTREMLAVLGTGDRFPVEQVEDTRSYLEIAKAEGSILGSEQILKIQELAGCGRKIKQFLRSRQEELTSLSRFGTRIRPLKELEQTIGEVISEYGEVKDSASPELQRIRRQMSARKTDVRNELDRLMRNYSKSDMVEANEPTIRSGRMVVPLKAEYKRKVSGFVHDVSATGQTVYLEPAEVLTLNNEIRELEAGERREIERLMQMLTAEIRSCREDLLVHHEVVSELDAILAVAKTGEQWDGIVPELSRNTAMDLNTVYNPVLWLKSRNKSEVVPLTLNLEPGEQGVMITGPNAGGKSVTLKTIGLCQMMMQCGFPLPSNEGTRLPVLPALFVDLGDEQSMDNDLSTFSSRLEWMKTTLNSISEYSLVLIDEAGTGTDPAEGTALFQALFEKLQEMQVRTIATTHHGDLKEYAHRREGWVNASMLFDQEHLSPTYHFQKGVPGGSYAFEIASRLGLPAELVDRARSLVGESKNRMEDLIVELEKQRQELLDQKAELNRRQKELDDVKGRYDRKYSKVQEETERIRQQALDEAAGILQEANKKVEQAVKEVSESQAEKESVKEVRKELDSYRKEVAGRQQQKSRKKKKKSGKPPEVGDTVQMQDSHTRGVLKELSGNQAVIEVNGMRLKTKLSQLEKIESTEQPKEPKSRGWKSNATVKQRATNRIDLRGKRAEEAQQEVERFIDEASTAGLHQLEIVHGKGNGVLKQIVHEHLARRREITSYEIAPEEQGGHGCTLAELKQ